MDPSKQKRKIFIVSRNKELQEFMKEVEDQTPYVFEFINGTTGKDIPSSSAIIFVGKNEGTEPERLVDLIVEFCGQIQFQQDQELLEKSFFEDRIELAPICEDLKKSMEVASRHIETLKMNDFQRFGKGDRKKNKSNFKKQFRR